MAGIMDSVDQRTTLAGTNRMELLLFQLAGAQLFGINVFKVREVIPVPRLVQLPHADPTVAGVCYIRDRTIAILDLARAITGRPLEDRDGASVIVSEYNRSVQGFMVRAVDRIVNVNWKDIMPPPSNWSSTAYLTGVTRVDERMVQIIDVEKVMDELNRAGGLGGLPGLDDKGLNQSADAGDWHVLVVDDSSVARRQIRDTLNELGLQSTMAKDGEEALETLRDWASRPDESPWNHLLMVISDLEMPRKDGYTLATEIRRDDALKGAYILLHSSLSGTFNTDMVKQVGADEFLAKFAANELAERVQVRMEQVSA
ncbi:chemotaxis protein CheV [Aquisalimonas sp. 2447]|uniref:chemotaxis protein n=1 Tax=Aquisalimonas sp. 2447 TaxID=2740807 RepID=UPI00143231EF|nr:chemotaxis protein [Aquisalimonas sp. 2447]QIT56178.1 chemotaxis protein CheV [Aquisalimonas sp. 2447]